MGQFSIHVSACVTQCLVLVLQSVFKGIEKQGDVGLLSLFEHYGSCQVMILVRFYNIFSRMHKSILAVISYFVRINILRILDTKNSTFVLAVLRFNFCESIFPHVNVCLSPWPGCSKAD